MKTQLRPDRAPRKAQQGAVLVIALIMLLAMTLIGVTGLSSTTMQERMAGNLREINIAFQAAEAALREGENYLTAATLPDFNGSNGLYQPAAAGTAQVWTVANNWTGTASRVYAGDLDTDDVTLAAAPRYIIEELAPVPAPGGTLSSDAPAPETGMYRITARAFGRSDTTIVMLQTTYKR
jgi:type IV pilus assembly protein PilX